MDADAIKAMTVEMLKEKLRELGLAVSGRKKELQLRLLQHVILGDDEEEEEEEGAESGNESTNSLYADAATTSSRAQRVLFTLRDVKDSVSFFFGDGTYDVEHWVEEFDDTADTVSWNNLQRFVYAKQLLKGAAKLLVRGLVGVRDWSSLKQGLINEFGKKLCASEVHRALRNRRKQPKETFQEYLYALVELGKQISLDERSLVEYFVEGIPDVRANKSMLYQARTLSELKEHVRVYEKVKGIQTSGNKNGSGTASAEAKGATNKKCFKCDKEGHIAKDCPGSGSKGITCFKCKQKGHYAHECQDKKGKEIKSERVNTIGSAKSGNNGGMNFVDALIEGLKFNALVDTGCNACIMRYDTLFTLGDIELTRDKQKLRGIGNGELTTLGSFTADMIVDGLSMRVTFQVVKERDIPYAAIIGNDVLKDVELVFRKGSVELRKPKKEVEITNGHAVAERASAGVYGDTGVVVPVHDEFLDKNIQRVVSEMDIAGAYGGTGVVVPVHHESGETNSQRVVSEMDIAGAYGGIGVVVPVHDEYSESQHAASQMDIAGASGGTEAVVSVHENRDSREVVSAIGITGACGYTGMVEQDVTKFKKEFQILCAIETEACGEEDKVDLSHLSENLATSVMGLIKSYYPEKPSSTPLQMKLTLTDDKPVFQRPRRVSYADQKYIDEQVENMLKEGIIQHGVSEYASPMVLTTKKTGQSGFVAISAREKKNPQQNTNEIIVYEETNQEFSLQRNGSKIVSRKSSISIKRSCSNGNKDLFGAVFELAGLKEKDGAKEFGTLILLGVMLLLFIISIIGFFIMWFTEYYNNAMLSQIVLRNGSEMTKNWVDPNPKYDTLLKVHIFNYTNIDRYFTGIDDKIKVEDIGPLTYKEHTSKVNVSFNENFTVTFRDHRSYEFIPEKSSHGEFDKFVLPNVPLISASTKMESMNMFKKMFAEGIINSLNEEGFKSLTAHEFLWGYRDRIVSMDIGTGSTHFGLLMNRNGTSVDSLQINTGEDDIRKFSIIAQFNGQPLLNFWTEEECNRIDGSDASMFPPHILQNRDDLQVFLQVLCRKIPLHFEKEVTILNNIDALRYRTPLNVFSNPKENPANACYCHNTQLCLPSGIINATKCYNGAPIFPSFPHFFSGDPEIYSDIDGIEPIQELHQTYADIHPRFAFPISGASRIQINIAVHKGPILRNKMYRIREGTILPLIWIEITSGDFTDEVIDTLYISTFGLNAIQHALKYGTLLACIISFSLIVGGFYNLTQKRRQKNVPIHSDIDT